MSYTEKPRPAWTSFPTMKLAWKDMIIRPLEKGDVTQFCAAIRENFPHLAAGRFAHLHLESYYEQAARALEGRDGSGILCAYAEGKLVGGFINELDSLSRSVLIGAIFATKDFRRNPAIVAAVLDAYSAVEKWYTDSKAEYAFSYCTTAHTASQIMLEKQGYKIGGVLPGFALAKRSYGVEIPVDSSYYRENMVFYYRYLNDGELLTNKRMRMTPAAQAFWNLQQGWKPNKHWAVTFWLWLGRLRLKLSR